MTVGWGMESSIQQELPKNEQIFLYVFLENPVSVHPLSFDHVFYGNYNRIINSQLMEPLGDYEWRAKTKETESNSS